MARPTKLTPDLMSAIVRQVALCVPPTTAAGAFGVSTATYYEWIARGKGTDPDRMVEAIYVEFAEKVAEAERQAESALVMLAIQKARTTRDALDVLERRFGGTWQQKTEIHVDVRHMLEGLATDPEELEAATAEAERLMGIR